MSQLSEVTRSRDQWRGKTTQSRTDNRYLRREIARVKTQRDQLDALDILLAFEGIEVVGFLPPASLSLGFADVTALGLGAVALAPNVAMVGIKEPFTVQTFTLSSGVCHRPGSPPAHDAKTAVGKEENRQEKGREEEAGRRLKKGIDIKGEGSRRNGLIYHFKLATEALFLIAADRAS